MLVTTSTRRQVAHALRLTSRHLHSSPYDQTVANLDLCQDTRVIFQGFTGKAATANAKQSLAYGTNIVGGVSPGKGGQTHPDRPVFNTMREAVHHLHPHATVVFVPAPSAATAILSAIESQVPLVVTVAEHVPAHDMLRLHQALRTQHHTRLVGPNCPGLLARAARCRLGIMPCTHHRPGCVAIVSKSGTLSYEAVAATTAAGLGQSLVVGMGGDLLPGTNLVDALELFFRHDQTRGIIVIGEIGGEAEIHAAQAIRAYRARCTTSSPPKPVVAMVAGHTAPTGRIMGHAGAVLLSERDLSAAEKADALRRAGAVVVPHPGVMGDVMKKLLAGGG